MADVKFTKSSVIRSKIAVEKSQFEKLVESHTQKEERKRILSENKKWQYFELIRKRQTRDAIQQGHNQIKSA